MSLRPGWEPEKVNLSVLSGRGGLGDSLARLPAFRYMHDNFPHVSATVYVQDGWLDIVRYLLPETPRRCYKALSEAPYYMPKPFVEFNQERVTSLFMHLTDQAFVMLMDMLPPSCEAAAYAKALLVSMDVISKTAHDLLYATLIYPKIIVFTTDYTARARQWPAVHINALAVKCREAGLTPVLLGTIESIPSGVKDDPIQPRQADGLKANLFIDLRNKTTLIEALGVMQRAKAVVGVDNGLLHLAHCTDVPVVMGFTTLKSEHRVPVRAFNWDHHWRQDGYTIEAAAREAGLTETIESLVPCAGCQSRGWHIQKDAAGKPVDWRKCVFDDYACTLTLTADRFWDKLKELGVVS